ncbi:MAG: LysR family transcriptional regulator [Archangium sp.]|nr:LysR family transcriptional regulator [Archangium sp.]
MDSWDDVQLFLALMRTRRLSLAGKSLGFDTSTASRRLAKLEAALDVSLFDRTREGLVPTAAARKLLASAEDMERASHQFASDIESLEREVEGVVRLSAPPGVAESFLVTSLVELRERHPKLNFEVDASTRQADLTRREADVALRTIRPAGGPLVMQRLNRTPWVPLAAPSLVRTLEPLRDWTDVPWIGWSPPLHQLHVARWLDKRVKTPLALRTNSFVVQVNAALSGLGAVLAPAPYEAVHALQRVPLSRALARDAQSAPEDDLWLVTHESLRRVPRVASVWDFLARRLTSSSSSK